MLSNYKFIPYNPELKEKAKNNRKNPTCAESKFWFGILKSEPFRKYTFNRQKPLLDYIVDFYCSKLKLIIEIDGDTHADRKNGDILRTESLTKYGIKVIRNNNSDVLNNMACVYDDLLNKLKLN